MKNAEVRFLRDDEFGRWDEFVESSPQGNIFNKSYWLKAVCTELKILICEENGKIVGGIALPSMYGKFYRNPKLTPKLGMLLSGYGPKVKYSTALSKDMDITGTLLKSLPDFKQFDYNFSQYYTNFLPFIWQGFNVGVGYTYVIEDLSDMDSVFSNFQYDAKYSINRATKKGVKVDDSFTIKDFYEVNKKTFVRQDMEIPYTLDFLINLDNVLAEHNNRKMYFALNEENKIIAGVYLLYDSHCTYYLMGGADPEYRDTGAQALLLWESIKFASQVSHMFDFEGSMVPGIEKYFRDFGGKQQIIYRVYKSDPLMDFAYSIARKNKNLIRKFFKI